MLNKKGQVDIRELLITLVIAGVLFIVGLLIFANVTNSTESILDPSLNTQLNETINITFGDPIGANSTTLANAGVISLSDVLRNGTNLSEILVRNTDYVITFVGASGGLTTTANITLITSDYNISEIMANYDYNSESPAQASNVIIQSTVLDSFELGVIALIVLAAVVILGVLFRLGSQ